MAALEKILNNHLAVPGYDQIGKGIIKSRLRLVRS